MPLYSKYPIQNPKYLQRDLPALSIHPAAFSSCISPNVSRFCGVVADIKSRASVDAMEATSACASTAESTAALEITNQW